MTDNLLFDATADRALPLSHHFDGLGVLVARSSWEPDATYVSFKAGDNYWSHSHLDQGAFMIYKGADLALDSGCYCGGYASDHHLNYTYQTIAHNTLTVTDPADAAPMPPRKEKPARPIANDGGQRRVGSGWGADPAPLDRMEWEARLDTYHTGRIERLLDEDGLVVAVADITAAYTNAASGEGRFAERTRRVERAWRVFAYDRPSDTIVIYDDVRASHAEFTKRWLLHSQTMPRVSGNTFTIDRATPSGPARLTGTVLHPSAHTLLPLGGPGFEFFVDGQNYDNGGSVQRDVAKRKPGELEAGNWRLELSPDQARKDDHFLVVLQPTLGDSAPAAISPLGDQVGVEISTGRRVVRLSYKPGQLGILAEIVTPQQRSVHDLTAGATNPVEPPGFIERAWHRLLSLL